MNLKFLSVVAVAVSGIVFGASSVRTDESPLDRDAFYTAEVLSKYVVRSRRCNQNDGDIALAIYISKSIRADRWYPEAFKEHIGKIVKIDDDLIPPECNMEALRISESLYDRYKAAYFARLDMLN